MARKKKPITAEEFAAWLADPVTEVVIKAHADMAEQLKQGWLDATWLTGTADPLLLIQLKTRADAYLAIAECSYEDIVGDGNA
jgi:hypothetical protein